MRKGAPVLADAERHRSTPENIRHRFGSKLVSIYTRARVGGSFWGLGRVLNYDKVHTKTVARDGKKWRLRF